MIVHARLRRFARHVRRRVLYVLPLRTLHDSEHESAAGQLGLVCRFQMISSQHDASNRTTTFDASLLSDCSALSPRPSVSRRRFEPQPKPRGSMATEEEASSKRQLAKYRSRLRLHLFVSAPQIVGRRLASLASAHASLEKALRLAGQTSVFSASAPNSPVVSHVADVWSLAELRS